MRNRPLIFVVASALAGCAAHARHSASAPDYASGGYAPSTATAGEAYEATAESVAVMEQRAPREAVLTAASVGDHDRRGAYLDFLERHPYEHRNVGLDTTRRQRIHVVDGEGRSVRGARVSLGGRPIGTTFADGVFDVYPGVLGVSAGQNELVISHENASVSVPVVVPERGDGDTLLVRLDGVTARAASRLELAFLIDVTGSMEDELRYVNYEVGGIVERVRAGAHGVDVRVGATFYRDRGDRVPLSKIELTRDVDGFAQAMNAVRADGGGDYPEDLESGLEAAMHRLAWSSEDAVRVIVLITDAPAQSYGAQFGYEQALVEAGRRGIRILPVAASGADRTVEVMLRAMGAYTGAPYVYLTDHSGIGASHLEADTDRVRVEHFSLLLARLLLGDLAGIGMHEPGFGTVPDFDQQGAR